eukprot:7751081-Alexandrium_andersonii.AAC.1
MSASLVGSEMCIRDRANGIDDAAENDRKTSGRSGGCLGLPGADGLTDVPVSYTHLTLPTICSV